MGLPPRKYWMASRPADRLGHAHGACRGHAPQLSSTAPPSARGATLLAVCSEPQCDTTSEGPLRWMKPGAITAHFQPIYRLRGDVMPPVAVESLARGPRDSAWESPSAMFAS